MPINFYIMYTMKLMLKTLSTLWLAIALAIAPLQAMTATVAAADAEPCQMHVAGGDNGMAEDNCPSCDNHDCSSNGCNHQGCTSVHIQIAQLLQVYNIPALQPVAPALMRTSDHPSIDTPPLLRPPA